MGSKKEIRQLINKGCFEPAYEQINGWSSQKIIDFLSSDMYHDEGSTVYAFLMYILSRKPKEEGEWHYHCFAYMTWIGPWFDDAYALGAWHFRKVIELEPENIERKAIGLHTFYTYPGRYFSKEEYKELAKSIYENREYLESLVDKERLAEMGAGSIELETIKIAKKILESDDPIPSWQKHN